MASTPGATPAPDATQYGPPVPAVLPAARSAAENPVVASLTPFYKQEAEQPAASPAATSASKGLVLQFTGDSWVEVVGRGGQRLAYGLLPAGTVREFAPGTVAKVSLGNASAVQVRMNGEATDLSAFRRANVARFTVSLAGHAGPGRRLIAAAAPRSFPNLRFPDVRRPAAHVSCTKRKGAAWLLK